MDALFLLSWLLTGGAGGLASDDFGAREAAEARLTRAGAAALPVLWAAEASADPEVRWRAGRVLAASRAARTASRAALLWRAHLLLRVGAGRPYAALDPWQEAEVGDGGPELWAAVDVLAAAACPTRPPFGLGPGADAERARGHVRHLRLYVRLYGADGEDDP